MGWRYPQGTRWPADIFVYREFRMPRANLAIQVVPLGEVDDREAIEAAIRCIRGSGLNYVVGPMETTIEGDTSDELIRVALAAHREAVSTDLKAVQTNIRLLESPSGLDDLRARVAPFMDLSNR